MLVPFEDYERLRDELAEKHGRIEELHEDNDALIAQISPKAGYFFIDEQIDAAMECATHGPSGVLFLRADKLGVVACSECGGEGVVDNNRMKPVSCVPCHGHGWVVK